MACKSCEERRKMIKEAAAKSGAGGIIRIIPRVVAHTIARPPVIRKISKKPTASEE